MIFSTIKILLFVQKIQNQMKLTGGLEMEYYSIDVEIGTPP